MPFTIVRDDITKMNVDAIVNASNTNLLSGGGVCGAIFKAAGAFELRSACSKFAPIMTGAAIITPGFKLPAKYIIHAAGPIYKDGYHGEADQLRMAYTNSLKRAVENNCESVAFPLISSGTYGYPRDEAIHIATTTIRGFIAEHDINVILVVFDKETFTVSKDLFGRVASYIDEHYVESHNPPQRQRFDTAKPASYAPPQNQAPDSDTAMTLSISAPTDELDFARTAAPSPDMTLTPLDQSKALGDLVAMLDEPFTATLLRLIDSSGKTDAEVYKRANIDRRLFSKIRSNPHYAPSKPTVLAFCIALELTLTQTADLLGRAGFALSHSRKFDVIVEYFITAMRYDIFEINEVLFSYDQALLG